MWDVNENSTQLQELLNIFFKPCGHALIFNFFFVLVFGCMLLCEEIKFDCEFKFQNVLSLIARMQNMGT